MRRLYTITADIMFGDSSGTFSAHSRTIDNAVVTARRLKRSGATNVRVLDPDYNDITESIS